MTSSNIVLDRDSNAVRVEPPVRTFTANINATRCSSSSSSSDAKRSAEASRRCDCSPERSVLRWLQGLSRCNTRDTTNLVDPGGGWSTTGTSPLLRGPVTIPRLGTDSKDLVCRYITSKSGDVTKQAQSSFADDV